MFERIEIGETVIVIAPVEDESVYYPLLTATERDFMLRFSNSSRRASWAAWRAAAKSVLGDAEIGYNDLGAPVVMPGVGFGERQVSCCRIGVSHTRKYAVVIVSPHPCAIDIEDAGRNFDRVAGKYISAAESALNVTDCAIFNAVVWCAKETLYKISGRRGLELTDDLRITSFDAASGKIIGGIRSVTGEWCDYRLEMFIYGECVVTWLIDDSPQADLTNPKAD